MALSKKKLEAVKRADRIRKVNERSLNGKGYFMDAAHDLAARKYIDTGDESLLSSLPDYRTIRKQD